MNPNQYGVVDLRDPDVQIPKGLKPLVDHWMRDPRVTLGHDQAYYLTGTTRVDAEPHAGRWSDGIRLWRSQNLRDWEPLGLVWTLDGGGGKLADFPVYEHGAGRTLSPEEFQREVLPRLALPGLDVPTVRRSLWAPELHWLRRKERYLLSFCVNTNIAVQANQWTAHGVFGGNYFLTCPSGDPCGPWELVSEDPATDHIDGTVFEDDDGSAWFVWQSGRMARFTDDFHCFDAVRDPWQTSFRPEPTREGPFVVKQNGLYHLFVTIHSHRRQDGVVTYAHEGHGSASNYSYDLLQASSHRLTGPYGPRRLVALGSGHGHPLQDAKGNWWMACFGNTQDPYQAFEHPCRPHLVPMHWRGGDFLPDHTPGRIESGLPVL